MRRRRESASGWRLGAELEGASGSRQRKSRPGDRGHWRDGDCLPPTLLSDWSRASSLGSRQRSRRVRASACVVILGIAVRRACGRPGRERPRPIRSTSCAWSRNPPGEYGGAYNRPSCARSSPSPSSAAFLAWAVRGRSASVFGPSVWRGPRDRPAIALTFDDGPSESTPEILEILARHGIARDFLPMRRERRAAARRSPARSWRPATTIGNHSHTHPLLCLRSPRSSRTSCGARRSPSRGTPAPARVVSRAVRSALVRPRRGAATRSA